MFLAQNKVKNEVNEAEFIKFVHKTSPPMWFICCSHNVVDKVNVWAGQTWTRKRQRGFLTESLTPQTNTLLYLPYVLWDWSNVNYNLEWLHFSKGYRVDGHVNCISVKKQMAIIVVKIEAF